MEFNWISSVHGGVSTATPRATPNTVPPVPILFAGTFVENPWSYLPPSQQAAASLDDIWNIPTDELEFLLASAAQQPAPIRWTRQCSFNCWTILKDHKS